MGELRSELPTPTGRLAALPIDKRGYPVPWFVATVDGEPDHRVMDGEKKDKAWQNRLCWICGQPLGGATVTYAIGPMCAVNRISAEPPSHRECAEYSVKACPFLSRPHAHRREADLPDDSVEPDGIMLKRNPGVILLWTARRLTTGPFVAGDAVLFNVGEPAEVQWFCQGREATREEIEDSINSGLPILLEMAEKQGDRAVSQLARQVEEAWKLLPT
jgi:hypothetical protein